MVTAGLNTPEGPVVLDDGRIAVVQIMGGAVSIVDTDGSVQDLWRGPGRPNGMTLGDDGLYLAQCGGPGEGDPSLRPPAVERLTLDGHLSVVADRVRDRLRRRPCGAPNDLAFGPDGSLWCTDPAEPYSPDAPRIPNRILRVSPEGRTTVAARPGRVFTNGIGFSPAGELVWVQSYDRAVVVAGRVAARLPAGHVPDGFAFATDGRMFCATVDGGVVDVIDPEAGRVVDEIRLDDEAVPSNCCFDGSTLWVTDFRDGRLWRVETDAQGAPLWRGSAAGRG